MNEPSKEDTDNIDCVEPSAFFSLAHSFLDSFSCFFSFVFAFILLLAFAASFDGELWAFFALFFAFCRYDFHFIHDMQSRPLSLSLSLLLILFRYVCLRAFLYIL